MSFETLTLRPVDGHIDASAIGDWLNQAPFVRLDPVEGRVWQMEASPRTAVLAALAREADPQRFPPGVLIWLDPHELHVEARAEGATLRRLRSFLRWLLARGEWRVKADWGDFHLLLDLDDLFRGVDLGESDLVDDLTVPPVVSGALVRVGRVETWLHVHSDGQLRLEDGADSWSGRLSPGAVGAWNAAVDAIDFDDSDLPDQPEAESAWVVERERPGGADYAMLDGGAPPPTFAAVMRIACGWIEALRSGVAVEALG